MIKQESLDRHPFELQEEVPGLSCAKNIWIEVYSFSLHCFQCLRLCLSRHQRLNVRNKYLVLNNLNSRDDDNEDNDDGDDDDDDDDDTIQLDRR